MPFEIRITNTPDPVQQPFRDVVCNFTIENQTNTNLVHKKCDIIHGEIPQAPRDIESGTTMKFSSQKTNWAPYGVAAMSTWKFQDRLIFLYWHIPLSFVGGYNRLFIGITHPDVCSNQPSVKRVCRESSFLAFKILPYDVRITRMPVTNLFKSFTYANYESGTQWLEIEDKDIKIRATMGTNRQCEATVQIIPHRETDLAM